MANPILLKSSSTAGAVPAAGSLTVRELALNTADGRLFTKTGAGSVVEFARKDAIFNSSGFTHTSKTSFDAQGAISTFEFGYRFVQGLTNGPGFGNLGGGQYYSWFVGLGREYPYTSYGMQTAIARDSVMPYYALRFEEGGVFGAWQKISAGYADTAGAAPASDVYAWAKAATKPSYTATEVGLGNVPNLAFSGSNTGDETLATIKSKLGITTLSGTNTGDNAVNTTYTADYRAANFVAGTHYLAPTGSAASLTGLTSGQVTTALGYTPSNPGGLSVSVIGTNTTATAGTTYVLTASLILALPAAPTSGLQVGVVNRSGAATCVVGRNSSNIMGLAQDMTLDVDVSINLVFADATRGWVLL